ncbi:flavin reductase family protein [Streptomyces sp. HK10]|uniref:flavin reductase family protein n=1 Tax=Streptomyces sp. HK10 TaxID=3373255 RepID=UPI00374A7163
MRSTRTDRSGPSDRERGRPPQVGADAFRSLMSGFPSGVAVVTSVDRHGAPRGLTCTSMCSVGLTPPSLLVCLDNRSGTLRALRESGAFAVNLLHTGGRSTAETFAAPGPDRFSKVAWEPTARHLVPRLTDDAHATAECRVLHTHPAGDHTVVIGAVEDVVARPGPPLLYGQRRFADWSRLAEVTVEH